jgi:hypothetical protein
MWNENAPFELLKELPAVLNDANLARLQSVIDYDKFINSTECGYDLCGSYAPFCNGCDKSGYYPCAVAYVKMKQSQGYDVELQNRQNEEVITMEQVTQNEEQAHAQQVEQTKNVAEVKSEDTTQKKKKSIRIAVAKRRS